MKAQISRDSFNEEMDYSAVYQQQGRMLTDADWNEMVRILKQRMDRTVGGSIGDGSPREGGILDSAETSFEAFAKKPRFKWGRVYVDGLYGEVRGTGRVGQDMTITEFLRRQRDYPSNPYHSLEASTEYLVYIDLWERLVVALEDSDLADTALHGADTCVRTQTMAQVKLTKIKQAKKDEDFDLSKLPARGTARVSVDVTDHGPAPSRELAGNALFRLEVHSVRKRRGQLADIWLKWSTENGAEERDNREVRRTVARRPTPGTAARGDFLTPDHVYECFSTETEKHLGEHPLNGINGWQMVTGKLYSYAEYLEALKKSDSLAATMPRIRRWDGALHLTRKPQGQWQVQMEGHPNARVSTDGSCHALELPLESCRRMYKVKLTLEGDPAAPGVLMPGDYWLVLLRDNGSGLTADPLSEEPVGINHHYMAIGMAKTDTLKRATFHLDKTTWRSLSFPSLSRMTLDRVLVEDKDHKEVSVDDKFVAAKGDNMTGQLTFGDPDNPAMKLSNDPAEGPSIRFDPPDSGDEGAWVRAESEPVGAGASRRTTLELGVGKDWHDNILLDASGSILLDASRFVGVGTRDPRARLDVKGTVRIDAKPDANAGFAEPREIQKGHPDKNKGLLEAPWVYAGHIQGSQGGSGGADYARISMGDRPLKDDCWDESELTAGHDGHEPKIGFGFGEELSAVLNGGELAVRNAIRTPRLTSPGDLHLRADGDGITLSSKRQVRLQPDISYTDQGLSRGAQMWVDNGGTVGGSVALLAWGESAPDDYRWGTLLVEPGSARVGGSGDLPTDLEVFGDLVVHGDLKVDGDLRVEGGLESRCTVARFVALQNVEQGDVVAFSVDDEGETFPVPKVYKAAEGDKKVCGVVLDERQKGEEGTMVTAGLAQCKVFGPVQAGDLLMASGSNGCARRAPEAPETWVAGKPWEDWARARGAILGKAMGNPAPGEATIPILVNLR